jgi:hypothetical protein
VQELKEFEEWLSMVLFIINEKVAVRDSKSREV